MIIVAGGSGYLGNSIINHLIHQGCQNIINISSKKNTSLVNKVQQFQIDLVDYGEVYAALSKLENRIDVVINLAGRSKRRSKGDPILPEFDLLATESLHDLRILFNLARFMNDNSQLFERDAKLIDIGSLWASRIPYSPTYLDLGNEPDLSVLLAKANKRVFVKYLARELAKKGFTVNQLTPGWFPKPSNNPREDYIEGIVSRIPLGRIGTPSDLFSALMMLMSKETKYINGQEIIIDGGFNIY